MNITSFEAEDRGEQQRKKRRDLEMEFEGETKVSCKDHCFRGSTKEYRISQRMLQDALYGKRTNTEMHPFVLPTSHYVPTPKELYVSRSSLPGHHYGVYSKTWLSVGTRLGPFMGRKLQHSDLQPDASTALMWEILDESGQVSHMIDGAQQSPLDWLCLVNSARNDEEENLQAVQNGQQIYYDVTKPVQPGEELLVWYDTSHHLYMGVPLHSFLCSKDQPAEDNSSQIRSIRDADVGKFKCVVCQKRFNSRSNLRSHMRIHTLEKPFSCKFCLRAFSQSSTLRNHLRLHTGERPYRCDQCRSAYSQLAGLRAHQKSFRHREQAHLTSTDQHL